MDRSRHVWNLAAVLVAAGGLAVLGSVGPAGAGPRAPAALPHTVVATLNVGARPVGVGVNPVTHKVYVTNYNAGTVTVIDGLTNTVLKTIAVGAGPYYWVGVMPASNRVFVANNAAGTLSVIDGATDTVLGTVTGLTGAPEGVAVHEGRDRVYVTRAGNTLSVVDATGRSIAANINSGATSRSVAVNPLLDRAYIAKSTSNVLSVFDLATLAKVTDVDATGHPVVDPYTQRVWLADFNGPRLWLVDGLNYTVEGQVPLAFQPLLAAIDAPRACLYATYPGVNLLTVVDIVNRRELGALAVGVSPGGVGVDPTTGRVFVANEGSNTVTVIQGQRCDQVGIGTVTPGSTREPYPPPATATPSATMTLEPTVTSLPPTVSPVPPTATRTATGSPTSTATASRTVTPGPSPTRTRTATRTPTRAATRTPGPAPTVPPPCVCREVRARVPAVVINDALANAGRYYGWLYPLDPGKPPGPANPPRTCLTLRTITQDYHPVWNKPQWRVGCP